MARTGDHKALSMAFYSSFYLKLFSWSHIAVAVASRPIYGKLILWVLLAQSNSENAIVYFSVNGAFSGVGNDNGDVEL